MRLLGLAIGAMVIAIGVVGVVAPALILTLGNLLITQQGLYLVGALRVVIGILLIVIARASRAPKAVRTVGILVACAGIITPWFGVERSRVTLNWLTAGGPAYVRLLMTVVVALGALLLFAFRATKPTQV
jgi:hypothetical protein